MELRAAILTRLVCDDRGLPEMEGALLSVVAWHSRAGGVLTARALRGSPRGGAEGGEEGGCGGVLEDHNIDRCEQDGSQQHWSAAAPQN